MTDTQTVQLTISDHIAEVVLNRPHRNNAVDISVFEGLAEAGQQISENRDVRAVVLRGNGDHFCSGIDTALFTSNPDPKSLIDRILTLPEGETSNFFQKPCTIWQEIDVPVIAALHGVTYGAGFQIALGADIRIASACTRMSVMEIKWGLIPDMGISTTLPRLMRADLAKELIFTGRIVEADEALTLGLVTRITQEPDEAAHALALQIAQKNPDAIRRDKRLMNEAWTAQRAEALRLEAVLQAEVIGQPNQMEAVFANMQKRPPRFT
ncbi:crotonase/enoyl-CoA hydratase family protein [Sagittula sp. SSi028]|uniref:crotonase/enoyl-CoA hydratase family protein n=1 Tax=Sagittula sp. SSi028 TaxID=3400636 RepID=UPI003AF87158